MLPLILPIHSPQYVRDVLDKLLHTSIVARHLHDHEALSVPYLHERHTRPRRSQHVMRLTWVRTWPLETPFRVLVARTRLVPIEAPLIPGLASPLAPALAWWIAGLLALVLARGLGRLRLCAHCMLRVLQPLEMLHPVNMQMYHIISQKLHCSCHRRRWSSNLSRNGHGKSNFNTNNKNSFLKFNNCFKLQYKI